MICMTVTNVGGAICPGYPRARAASGSWKTGLGSPMASANRTTWPGSTRKATSWYSLPFSDWFSGMRSGSQLTPGHRDDGARDVVRIRARQEEVNPGHILRLPVVAERDQHQRHLADLLGDAHVFAFPFGLGEASLDETGGDGVDVDVERTELPCERPGQPDDGALGGRVIGLPGVAGEGGRGRGERDLAVVGGTASVGHLLLRRISQVRHGRPGGVVGSLQVDVQHEVPGPRPGYGTSCPW